MTITVSHLTKSFSPEARVVDDVSFTIQPGEMFFLLGPSGCGKTTLLRMLAGFITPDDGEILFNEKKMNRAPPQDRNTAMVFQNYAIWPHLTVYENVELPLTYRGMATAERKTRVQEALEKVGMAHRAKHLPSQLSGGQQQRVAVARAVAGEPLILLADEPTGNLDSRSGEAVMDLLRELHRAGATICMVTHDPRYARHADRSIHVFDGRVVEEQTEMAVTE